MGNPKIVNRFSLPQIGVRAERVGNANGAFSYLSSKREVVLLAVEQGKCVEMVIPSHLLEQVESNGHLDIDRLFGIIAGNIYAKVVVHDDS